MALLQSELQAIRYHLGFNQVTISAQAYLWDGVTSTPEQILQPYTQQGWLAHSPTAVPATPIPSPPAVATLILNEGTGTAPLCYNVGDTIVVDQGILQEYSTVQTVTPGMGTITCELRNAHSGVYPVTVEGGESIIRKCLIRLLRIELEIDADRKMAGVEAAGGQTGVKFFASKGGQRDRFDTHRSQFKFWRDELAQATGIGYPRKAQGSSNAGSLLQS